MRIYLSHSIRGIKGADAADEDMRANNARAASFGQTLREMFQGLNIYVPADGDEFVMLAYRSKFVGEKEILDVDCQIIDTCDAVLLYIHDQHVSTGMLIEAQHAHKTGKPIFLVKDIIQAEQVLNYFLGSKMT